jgi:ATP-dependent DNA helicase RecQ
MLNYDSNGESPETQCCDVCEHQASAALREESSVLSFFHRNKRCYSLNASSGKLAQSKSHFWSEEEARLTINHLLDTGKLKESKNPLWKGTIN